MSSQIISKQGQHNTIFEASDGTAFIAGVFSGISKLIIGHPFDTIKVRMQTAPRDKFLSPGQCLIKTLKHEGFFGLYKGATPPLIGWMVMDSVTLGSLNVYRKLIHSLVFSTSRDLPIIGHSIAGMMSGFTVSFIACPMEHLKARLQVQYNRKSFVSTGKLDHAVINCAREIWHAYGLRGIYTGLNATLIFRSFFWAWWGSYEIFRRYMLTNTNLSKASVSFWAGGLSAQCFWLVAYPADVVKQRIMTDEVDPTRKKYCSWPLTVGCIWREQGMRGFWRGFLPCFLRAFPANGVALLSYEIVMRLL